MKIKKLADFPREALLYIRQEDVVFTAYYKNIDGDWISIASSPSAKRLSNWLLDNGAHKVVHDYDLRGEV